MDKIEQFPSVEGAVLPPVPLHLAIGMFDGVHLGHRAVIEAAVNSARRGGGLAAVLTFRPHPSALFHPQSPTRLIFDAPAQARLMAGLGVFAVITQPFTPAFGRIEAEAFLPWLKGRLPRLAGVYVGENWRFGAGRRGDVALLQAAGRAQGVEVFSAPPVSVNGQPVNSTRIRGFLEAGDVAAANTLLGSNYASSGAVTPGKRLGRTLGFPTLNLPWSPDLVPRFGVYLVRVRGEGGDGLPARGVGLPGVANYGLRPTVERSATPLLETHLLAPCPFDAGDVILVEWLKFLRPEMKFPSVDDLRAQIARDVESARAAGFPTPA